MLMKYFYLFSIVSLLFANSVFSQGENNNWFFGNHAGVNFSSGSPLSINGGQTNAFEGASTVSDSSGQLLFYSDGRRVWNRNHQVMPNGSLLTSSGNDATQGVVIIPYPNHPNEYFIFTTNGGGIPPPESGPYFDFMAYSRIDMTLENGLGNVVDLNTPLQNHTGNTTWIGKVEAITVINNSNENYWVILPYQNRLLSYYVDENGVNVTPTQSIINFIVPTTSHIKVSPSNQFLAITEFQAKRTTLYAFDASTGQVASSTPLGYFILQEPSGTNLGIYSTEFSSDSSNIWLAIYGSQRRVYGFDLNNLNGAPTMLQSNNSFYSLGTLQRGPNDKIYLASVGNNYLIGLNNSNDLNNAFLDDQALFLGGNHSMLGLPQLVPILASSCLDNLVLTSPETNNFFLYEVSNNITTNSNYIVDDNQNITLSAGNSINLLPNTLIKSGSTFLAKIEGCETSSQGKKTIKEDIVTQKIYINLNDENNKPDFTLYPNPANSKVRISLVDNSMTINNISINSMEEKTLLKFTNINRDYFEFDISSLKTGIYIVNVETKNNGVLVKKLIVN